MARDLRPVYTAPTDAAAEARVAEFTATWGGQYPAIVALWRNARSEFVPFLDYDVEIRKIICSTNAIESLYARYRRAAKARGHFPTEQAALKCLYLVTRALDPTGKVGPVGDAVEAGAERLRDHLRRPYRPATETSHHDWLVGSATGAVPRLLPVRFPWPPAEPGVRVSTHRALHVSCPLVSRSGLPVSGSTGCGCRDRGSGNGSPRRWPRR